MMKKHFAFLFMAMMVAAVGLTFTSCGDDDDDNGGASGGASWLLKGTWTESSGIRKWTFYKDGTCTFEVDNQTYNPTKKQKESHWTSYDGQWSYDNNTKVLSTTLNSWNWVIVSQSDDMWTGQTSKGTLYTYYR